MKRVFTELDKQWRVAVFKRDKRRCKLCRKRGRMNAHHIESYNSSPWLRHSIKNGITLCTGCHKKFHVTYGNGDNTRFQFDEFTFSHFGIRLFDINL